MVNREVLQTWIVEALQSYGGSASIAEVAQYIWQNYETDLRNSGDFFYSWQYDLRWSCTQLRKQNIVAPADSSQKGTWVLSS